jgi:glycosyltransferase involved in cell wall biosynthesis
MCAYTQKILKFSEMMTELGHEVYLYCGEGSDVKCTELIQCITNQERIDCYGDYDWRTEFFKHDGKDSAYVTFNNNAVREINKRKENKDILCITMGNYQQVVIDGTGLLAVETGIGYTGTCTKFKVYESYSWMHYMYGITRVNDGPSYDCVIPNYFYPADFPYVKKKKDYYLYIGRIILRKGVDIAVQVTKEIGATLIIAGQGTLKNETEHIDIQGDHIKFVGSVLSAERSVLMGNAKAVFVPTYYIEPFGGVAVEAMMCGTPVITSDWGAFTETVLHGVTGYRCRTIDDYIWSAKNINKISTRACRDWAIRNFSCERIGAMYEEYFFKIMDLWKSGWGELHPERTELNWLRKY